MDKGTLHDAESREVRDERTGVRVRQVTDQPCIHHHPFFFVPAYDNAMRRLVFVSHRTGAPQIFAEIQKTGKIVQLTDVPDLAEWSVHPSHDGRHVYFTAGTAARRVETETQREETLLEFGDVEMREEGMVGAAMGTTALSYDDKWWAVPVKVGGVSHFFLIDTQTGEHWVILERDKIGHPQFHPRDSSLLRYAGPYDQRIWVLNRDGSGNRLVYKRTGKEWIVHETWLPGTREIVTANWPHGMIAVHAMTGNVRTVCSFNAWHAAPNRDGSLMVADTNLPDVGLQLFDPRDGVGKPRTLCHPEASNVGAHWDTDHCPYDDGPVKVHAPQHTHPHPSFSPDGKRVVFTSDRTGHAQVYEAYLDD